MATLPKEVSQYLAAIGKKGGKVRSEVKRHNAQKNGKKGGRPKKSRA